MRNLTSKKCNRNGNGKSSRTTESLMFFLYTVNSRYNRRNRPQIYVCYIVKYVISNEFYMVKYVINFVLLSVLKNNSVITMSVITRVDYILNSVSGILIEKAYGRSISFLWILILINHPWSIN